MTLPKSEQSSRARGKVISVLSGLVLLLALYISVCILLVLSVQRGPRIPEQSRGSPNAVLASFYDFDNTSLQQKNCSDANRKFFFGLATSAAQVEDKLNDSWIELATGDSGKVRAWKGTPFAEERLRFWSEPDTDLRLAGESGAQVFRLSIDWGRIVTAEPVDSTLQVDWQAVAHYQHIFRRIRAHGMRIMLTLFHFALPKWANSYGGWTDSRTVAYFISFAKLAKEQFGEYVDYWVTFNEPNIFVILTHCTGSFPPGFRPSLASIALCMAPMGAYSRAMGAITEAHFSAYEILQEGNRATPVGVAHFGALVRPYGIVETPGAILLGYFLSYSWIDRIQSKLDFLGINYYGREVVSMAGLMVAEDEEYSEAGRGLYPNGLFEVLTSFYQRYGKRQPNLRLIVTENGVGDSRDLLRRPFLIEHLLAVSEARRKGVPVDGYILWTLADNWEWIDGYCPKFGLVSVDRANNLTRTPRPSYYLFQQIAKTGEIVQSQRDEEWSTLQRAREQNRLRPFCRFYDNLNIAGVESRDAPILRRFSDKDWRFGFHTSPDYRGYCRNTVKLTWSLLARRLQRLLPDSEVGSTNEL